MTTLEREYQASRLKAIPDCKDKDESSEAIKLLYVAATETLSIPSEDLMLTTLRDKTWCQADCVKYYGAPELFWRGSVWMQTLIPGNFGHYQLVNIKGEVL